MIGIPRTTEDWNNLSTLLAALCAMIVVFAAIFVPIRMHWLNQAKPSVATVVRVEERIDDGGTVWKGSVYSFIDHEGNQTEFIDGYMEGEAEHAIGESMSILYSPDETSDALVDSFMSKWGPHLAAAIVGGIHFLAFGIVALITKRKINTNKACEATSADAPVAST